MHCNAKVRDFGFGTRPLAVQYFAIPSLRKNAMQDKITPAQTPVDAYMYRIGNVPFSFPSLAGLL